jgi:hypothetical protein
VESVRGGEMAKYFSKTYGEARWLFKEAALDMSKKYKYAEYRSIRIPSRTDQDLTIDTFYLPAQTKHERIAIFSSGVHGLEGMTGSAIEQLCMKEDIVTANINKATTGILFIHSVNPYGQKYHRKVTENNIDLGRNFITNPDAFSPLPSLAGEKKPAYSSIHAFLNPKKKYAHNLFENFTFTLKSLLLLAKYRTTDLRQGILEGQYEFEKGLYFGGWAPEPQVEIIGELLGEYLGEYKKVFAIDLHTGYGIPGNLHFFIPYATLDKPSIDATARIFEGNTIECRKKDTGYKASYEVKGSYLEYVKQLVKDKIYIPMTMRFGTIDYRRLASQVLALARIVHENQSIQFGYMTERDKKLIRKNFLDIYYPESETWRTQVLRKTREALPALMHRFDKL